VWITLTGIRARGRHGVLAAEQELGQEFLVDVRLLAEVSTTSDQLTDTVNYAEVTELVVSHVTGEPVQLIETLAGSIADELVTLDRVRAAEVTVHKPQAPLRVSFTDVFVTVARSNS